MSTTPQHCPTQRELDDLELLVTGAYAPLTGFNEPGSPVRLELPQALRDSMDPALGDAPLVEFVDPEGVPLATMDNEGDIIHLTHSEFGPFRRLHLSPSEVREHYAGSTFVPVTDALTQADLDALPDARIVFLALCGDGTPRELTRVGLLRATMAAAELLPDAVVVAVPLPSHDDPSADHLLGLQAVRNYAINDPIVGVLSTPLNHKTLPFGNHAAQGSSVVDSSSVVEPVETPQVEPKSSLVESKSSLVEPVETSKVDGASPVESTSQAEQDSSVGETYPTSIQEAIDFDRPALDERGLVLFFTGLSGSGKSTIARVLEDKLLEQGRRTVSSLDGDVVRRNLSAGLSFSKEDRETNIRRIGWVAAQISHHGGVAICSPIAPYDETRQQVRDLVEAAGGEFFLVHVATPLEECERRDRKGLYAKARAGHIPEFTGISSPYDVPEDPDVRIDTTGRTIEESLDVVLDALREEGLLDL